MTQRAGATEVTQAPRRRSYRHDRWMESVGIPIHRGYYVEDLRTLELGRWPERECRAAFVQLNGLEGVSEVRVTEIPPGQTLPPWKLGVDELVYVLDGRGITTLWREEGAPKKSFEWDKRSLFLIPRNYLHQFSNAQGDRPVRLMHYNYLPISMSVIPEPEYFLNNPKGEPRGVEGQEEALYAEAKYVEGEGGWVGGSRWFGNFFPDMQAWDKLDPLRDRGAGGRVVSITFPDSGMACHMSVFDPLLYKKAHRHGPGRAIVIPGGEGYSVLWPEGEEQVVVPWHEGSLFTPPDQWFHQHFNLGGGPARYLALAPLPQFSGHSEQAEVRARSQIEYSQEHPSVRQRFEEELGKRGLTSAIPEEAYKDKDYQWAYTEDDD